MGTKHLHGRSETFLPRADWLRGRAHVCVHDYADNTFLRIDSAAVAMAMTSFLLT